MYEIMFSCIQLVSKYFSNRIKTTEICLRKYKGKDTYKFLSWIKKILIFPVKLLVFISIILIKFLLIWLLPGRKYHQLAYIKASIRYVSNEFFKDLFIRRYSCTMSRKRCNLLIKLFYNGREMYIKCGKKNKDKTFFVIRPYYYSKPNEVISAVPHLLTQYYCVVQYIAYAKDHGWIPVVDWENYALPHSEEQAVHGTKNAWEYYWDQPSEYDLEEIYESKNVILGSMNIPSGYLPHLRTPEKEIKKYARDIIIRGSRYARQIHFNKETQDYINTAKEKLFPKGKKIMGVAIRGTAYSKINAGHHATQPTVAEMIELVKIRFRQWNADYIFFTNEEEETIEIMKETFGNKLIYLPRKRYRNYHIYSDNSPDPTNEDLNPLYVVGQRYQTNLDYITEMALLAQCDCLLSALSNGIKAVLLWGGERFEHCEIIDKGVYPEFWEKNDFVN